jgi:ubiquitin thioesterase protein OTUB1
LIHFQIDSPTHRPIITHNNEQDTMTHEKDVLTNAQLESIQNEIKLSQTLTSNLLPIQDLASQFDPSSNFATGCQYLSTKYKSYRAIRRDGNCYYRAFLFALCEKLLNPPNTSRLTRVLDFARNSIEEVTKYGYDRFAVETFQEELVDLLEFVSTGPSIEHLQIRLNEENASSDYSCWYLRCITSSYIKKDPDRFIHFIDDPQYSNVETFCAREVDPMGRESGEIQVLALSEAFGVCVNIEYLDGRDMPNGGHLVKHSFGPQNDDVLGICLLYRPGHYDILYE